MSSDNGEDVEFLKDQVHRLSVSLGTYQRKYSHIPPVEDGTTKSYDPKAPLPLNKRLLSPLLAEYDLTIDELNQQILMYQNELESMTSRVEQVTQENAKLHSELRKSLEARIEAVAQSSSAGSGIGIGVGSMMDTLQQQLDMVTKDRDNYRELLKKASNELDLLQKLDQDKTRKLLGTKAELVSVQQTAIIAKKAAEELEFNCNNLDEERIRCVKTVKAQETELSILQENFSQARAELKAATMKNGELKKSLDEATFQLRRRESERARAIDTENSLDDRLHIMQITITDLEGKLLATQRETAALNEEKADLEATLASVQAKIVSLEQREHEAVSHVKDSMQIAESALLEKEQATIKEQQMAKEVERLRATIATILKEAGERTRKEVDNLREECNKNIDKMGVEIHRLEQECSERQTQLERCQREKKAVEKELEKNHAQKPLEIVQTGENLHELQKRVCVAERARDDALVRVEALTAKIKSLESNLLDEKQANVQLADEHRKWQREVQAESQDLREQKIKAMGQVDELTQRLRKSEQAKEAAEMKRVQELATLEQRQEMKGKEMVYRLESSEDAHRKSIQELRNLLTAQHRVGAKWREESKTLSQKFERTISELKSELVRYRSRSEDLNKQLNHLKQLKDDLGKRLKEATNANTSLQRRLKDAEAQSASAMEQVTELASRERQLLHERRELNKQLDKFKLHIRHSTGTALPLPTTQQLYSSFSKQHRTSSFYPHHSRRSIPPAPSSSLTPVPPVYPPDNTQWNETLTELRQSIQQVREDLSLRRQHTGPGGDRGQEVGREEEDEQSVLSRRDLSDEMNFDPSPAHSDHE